MAQPANLAVMFSGISAILRTHKFFCIWYHFSWIVASDASLRSLGRPGCCEGLKQNTNQHFRMRLILYSRSGLINEIKEVVYLHLKICSLLFSLSFLSTLTFEPSN